MAVKDRLVRWFIKNVIIPRQEIIDKPGFVVCQYADKGGEVYLRELIYPESLYSELEKKIVEKYGDKGRQILYSAGKKFGMQNCSVSNFPKIGECTEKHMSDFVYNFVRYCECTWAKDISHKIDFELKRIEFSHDGYIVCRLNGLGHIWTEGCTAGFWAYLMDDPKIEGVQTKCQGRGDSRCTLICAPTKVLKKEKIKFFKETDFSEVGLGKDYRNINEIRETKYATKSFQDLVNAGFLKYQGGVVELHGERHFYTEASMYYLIENEISKLPGGSDILFDTAFEFGKRLVKKGSTPNGPNFITDYMSAMGWGDVFVTKKQGKYTITSRFVPWLKLADEIEFATYRGILSGMLSEFSGTKIKLKNLEHNLAQGFFTVIVSE